MCLLTTLLGLLVFSVFLSVECKNTTVIQWDVIALVQHWLPTNCKALLTHGHAKSCRMPIQADSWTVHGVWPTSFSGRAPLFCPHAATFRREELAPLRPDLDETWPDIVDAHGSSLWANEWRKHGTCLLPVPAPHTPIKYLQMGMQLQRKYNLKDILHRARISPSNNYNYTLQQFKTAVHKSLGKIPRVNCLVQNRVQYIKEIFICFSREWKMIDCNFMYEVCDSNVGIVYSPFK